MFGDPMQNNRKMISILTRRNVILQSDKFALSSFNFPDDKRDARLCRCLPIYFNAMQIWNGLPEIC